MVNMAIALKPGIVCTRSQKLGGLLFTLKK